MTALRCRPAGLDLDTMNATPVRPLLYALTLSLLANASGYAAGVSQSGGQAGPGNDSVRNSQSALAGASARPQTAALHGAPLATKSGVSAQLEARSVLSKPAVPVARGYLPRRPAADNRAGIPAAGPSAVRALGAASGSTLASRASSGVLLAGHRSVTPFKTQVANGVIGGARAAGPGSVGGPTNRKTVINASINGSALRHRY